MHCVDTRHVIKAVHAADADATVAAAACAVWSGYYVTQLVHATARGTLHNSPQHSEVTALCRLWLRAAATLDETNDRVDNSKVGDWSFIRSEPVPVYGDRYRIRVSTKAQYTRAIKWRHKMVQYYGAIKLHHFCSNKFIELKFMAP